ncbi:MAG: DUF5716 family protein [Lachnospiraceae bacterium]|nr:DUF5716 family protein [Lachnospiraceae bacterium]
MHIFDLINDDLFSPLAGSNKRRYMDILCLIWDKCQRMPMYAIEKSTIINEVEAYFIGLGEEVILDETEESEEDNADASEYRNNATRFLRRLRKTGWLEEKDGDYEEEPKLAVKYTVVPLLKSFNEIINPKIITYKGKLFKIYALLDSIEQQENPYETILKEVSEDMDDLNQSLRQLAASIEEYIDTLTKGKKPQEILKLFEKYEERIVVGAYHRFKTNDNLFYYRTGLYEQLDFCEDDLLQDLIIDYMEVEKKDCADARYEIKKMINKIRDDVNEMEEIMRVIDNKHIIYRTRAVQRAQFLLLSDGSVKSKINGLLQYYATQITSGDINAFDDTIAGNLFQIYNQNYFAYDSLATPSRRRNPTPIDLIKTIEALDYNLVEKEKNRLLDYARNALTSENVYRFAKEVLKGHQAVSASSIYKNDLTTIVKIIGLYTYSQANDRAYNVMIKDTYVEYAGMRFKDFIIEERDA